MTREEVVKWLESLKREVGKAENRTLWHYAESIDVTIKALQTDVVRCKDCKWYPDGTEVCQYLWDNDFCSYGERKEP